MKGLEKYPQNYLLAWSKAIAGKKDFLPLLMKSAYKELGVFVYALNNKEDARKWLLENGYPHLMALINGAEGNTKALEWLMNYNYIEFYYIAIAADGDEKAKKWLLQENKFLLQLALRIESVKDEIERNNNDIHKISPD
ncbi:MAG: hypothetical protein ACK4K0_12355 [Flavobacteriales bacterium]